MYPRLLWVLVADRLGTAVHTLGTSGLEQSPRGNVLLNQNSTEYLRHKFERVLSLTGVTHSVRRCNADRIFISSLTSGVNYHELITFSQNKRIIQGHYPDNTHRPSLELFRPTARRTALAAITTRVSSERVAINIRFYWQYLEQVLERLPCDSQARAISNRQAVNYTLKN
jgi:hypothetical protein